MIFLIAIGLLACNHTDDIPEDTSGTVEEPVNPRTDLVNLNLPEEPYNYADIDLPGHFFETDVVMADNTPNNNPITNEGATLGRVLFFDVLALVEGVIIISSVFYFSLNFADFPFL